MRADRCRAVGFSCEPAPRRPTFLTPTESHVDPVQVTDPILCGMGLFWDLYQQSQISTQSDRTASLGDRLDRLEADVRRTQQLLRAVIERLEKQTGTDLDGDGRIGR